MAPPDIFSTRAGRALRFRGGEFLGRKTRLVITKERARPRRVALGGRGRDDRARDWLRGSRRSSSPTSSTKSGFKRPCEMGGPPYGMPKFVRPLLSRSGKLGRECHRNTGAMWMMKKLPPGLYDDIPVQREGHRSPPSRGSSTFPGPWTCSAWSLWIQRRASPGQ